MSEENNTGGYDSTKKNDDATGNFKEEAKSTAQEFKEGWNQATQNTGENKKLLAGLLGIFLGAFGVHKFILGYNKEGIILLVGTLVGIATSCLVIGIFLYIATGIVGLIEGIIYLTKSDEEFYNTYQVGKKPWF
ncbi:TM2 domain-containing protein [Altibacter sp. HG106]|uniref:TM2 domain-containing protein n=1 Tax=Altibacter sp. HG106 TaxID=3023937 RepID=UPI002350B0E4|nr:TM2 domain-containing protein [Altibacter sp. HG106]MDC7994792.1 TM2 domain-containing protein [Altibacter sp. HG106]